MQQQIFPPVLPFINLNHFHHPIQLPNHTHYPLTPPLITNHPQHSINPLNQFHVSNLYFNTRCTAPLLAYHP
ncbi:aldehyde dehydrogenase family protein, partial [Staphylococcus epidermidis]|uniref:aldehyde dehydrogenase family protein n=1 Tax=Staphylococcus epidermidis TaxID=1282 RepID=UPI0037DA083E